MRVSTALLCLALVLIALFAAAEAREVASRSERRAAERARSETPKSKPAAAAAAAAAAPKADDDDDDGDDDKPYTPPTPPPTPTPVDPEDDEDDDDNAADLANKPAAPIDPDARENWADLDVMTSLWRAVSSGDASALENMLRENALVARMRSADGRSGLFWAYEYEQPDMVQALLRAGAREDVRDRDGNTPKDLAPKARAGSSGSGGGNRAKATDFSTCDSCVNAGFGWDTAASKCSATSTNKSCPDDDDDDDDKDEL